MVHSGVMFGYVFRFEDINATSKNIYLIKAICFSLCSKQEKQSSSQKKKKTRKRK